MKLIQGCADDLFKSFSVFVFPDLNVKFNYLCRASNAMIIRVKVMAWNDNQRLFHFLSEFLLKHILAFQYLPRFWYLGSRVQIPMSMGRLWLRVGKNFRNCTDLKEKLLKTDYQSNSFNMAVANELQSMQLLSDTLAIERSLTFHIDLLTDKAMLMGWNPTGK